MKKRIFFLFFLPTLLLAKWNNNYTFFGDDNETVANALLNALSYLLTFFGFVLFLYSLYKLLGSNSPEDKTRGALFTNLFFIILGIILMMNEVVIKKLLGVE